MTPPRDIFMTKLAAESEKRTKEHCRKRKAAGQQYYSYRCELFNRTVRQRKRGM